METELWPNLLRALAARGVPSMIANGRLSDRSFRRYRLVRGAMRRVLGDVTVFAMQSDEDARRVIALGAPPERVVVTGNLKHEPLPDPAGAADLWHRLLGLGAGQPVWIAGSTHRGEEEAVLEAHRRPGRRAPTSCSCWPRVIPERVGEVMALVAARRSGRGPAQRAVRRAPSAGAPVIVLDTVGELAQLYSIADVVFVGGSLVAARRPQRAGARAARQAGALRSPHRRTSARRRRCCSRRRRRPSCTTPASSRPSCSPLLADADLRDPPGRPPPARRPPRVTAPPATTLDLVARYLYAGRSAA